jgi:thymidylate synthase
MKSIYIKQEHLPLAWEKAVIACWQEGEGFPTEYDKPGDPTSRDVTALIHVTRPFDEPRIHRAFPGGLEDLEKYRNEVVFGVHDHWIDPAAGKWEYTYHQRLFEYRLSDGRVFDQIAGLVEKLRLAPHTRRAQAITWQVWNDMNISDPACLQRLWFRIADGKLHMNVHMRSNDAFKAGFMNMYGFTELQREIAGQLGVEPGEYMHIADSFHIYGSYFAEFEGFLKMADSRSPAMRCFDSMHVRDIFVDGCNSLLSEPDMPESKKELVRKRLDYLLSLKVDGPSALLE